MFKTIKVLVVMLFLFAVLSGCSSDSGKAAPSSDLKKEAYKYAVTQAQDTAWNGNAGKAKSYSKDMVEEYEKNGKTYYNVVVTIGKTNFYFKDVTLDGDSWTYWGMHHD